MPWQIIVGVSEPLSIEREYPQEVIVQEYVNCQTT
jgi:hypothetical protein